jgi:S1-C subfamily serine protease
VFCNRMTTEDMVQYYTPSLFRLSFIDKETMKTRGYGSGFFIDASGTGLTSAFYLNSYPDAKVIVKLQDEREFEAEAVTLPELIGIGFIELKNPGDSKFPHIPISTRADSISAGDTGYILGMKDKHVYFSDVYISSDDHKFVFKDEKKVVDYEEVIKTTGNMTDCCIGGPLLNSQGQAVGVLFNIEMGFGLFMPTSRLTKLNKKSASEWWFKKAWDRAKEGLVKRE